MMHMIKHHRYRQHQGNIRRVENVDNVGIAHERYRLVNRRDHDAVADNLVVEGENEPSICTSMPKNSYFGLKENLRFA